MTRIYEPSAEDLATYQAWVESRPPEIRAVAERLDTWTLYRLTTTGQLVQLYSIQEASPPEHPGITLAVTVLRAYNGSLTPEFEAFGIDPDDLEPAETTAVLAPAPDTAAPATD